MDAKRREIGPKPEASSFYQPLHLLPRSLRRVRDSGGAAARWLASPPVLVSLMLLSATVSAVAGIFMLAGTAWALIAAATILFALAALTLRGMMWTDRGR